MNALNGTAFKVITSFTGKSTLDEVLQTPSATKLLWLEIIFNDAIEWENYLDIPAVKEAYEKASIWYYNFLSLIKETHTRQKPLTGKNGTLDYREYRRFMEVLGFVSGRY